MSPADAAGQAGAGSDQSIDPVTTSVARFGKTTVLSVGGDVDLLTVPALVAAISAALLDEPAVFVIDLSAVTFLGTVGLRALVTTHETVSRTALFAVVAEGPLTARPIELTGLDAIFSLYPSLNDALSALGGSSD